MDFQFAFNTVLGICLVGAGWFARVMWEANKELRQDLANLREKIAETYVTKVDFRDAWREVMDLLRAIDGKLDRKADK